MTTTAAVCQSEITAGSLIRWSTSTATVSTEYGLYEGLLTGLTITMLRR